jgi:hypothetical protein
MKITLNLIATKEDDEGFGEDFGVDMEVGDDVDITALVRSILYEGVETAQSRIDVSSYTFFN